MAHQVLLEQSMGASDTCHVHRGLCGAIEVVQLGMWKHLLEPAHCRGRKRLATDKHVTHSGAGAIVDLLSAAKVSDMTRWLLQP